MNDIIIEKLKERYKDINPLIFHRSKEKAKTDAQLFDILDSFPKEFPVTWDELTYRWVTTKNIFDSEGLTF